MDRTVIAIDGPSASGKSTVARLLAERLGYRFLDSGAMYRAFALLARRRGVAGDDEEGLAELVPEARIELRGERVLLDGEDVSGEIRTPEIDRLVSQVARVPAVRRGMVARQRAAYPGEPLVVEGRDIGSVVFPDARVKVFLDASPEERARRRARESHRDVRNVLEEQRERDERDSRRAHSPLVKAAGAVVIDTTGLTLEEVVERLLALTRDALRSRPGEPSTGSSSS